MEELASVIRDHAPGDRVRITYVRDDSERTVTATLKARE
jgi:S1-C subfamily serine protease